MKVIKLKKRTINYDDYNKRSALESDFTRLVDESCILEDADTGEQFLVYKKLDEEGLDSYPLEQALHNIRYETNRRLSGIISQSRIFGYKPREGFRNDFCSSTSMAAEHPKEHALLLDYGARVAALYAKTAPKMYEYHRGLAEDVLKQWMIQETPFTSGIVNKNNPLKYHLDSGNFENVYSNMLAIRKDTAGGYLALPEYDAGLAIENNSVTIFDGQKLLHGVTPIKFLTEEGFRYTIVYYSLKKMWDCLPVSDEIKRIRRVKTQIERNKLK